MSGDWIFDACVLALVLSIAGFGAVIGFVWGFGRGVHLGIIKAKAEPVPGWKPIAKEGPRFEGYG